MSDKTTSGPLRRNIPEDLGRALLQELGTLRAQLVSLHDPAGDTLWLSEGSMGPDEHNAVLTALDVFALEPRRACIYRKLDDGRRVMFLVARDPLGGCSGVVFAVIEGSIQDERRVVTPALRTLLQRFSMLRAPLVEQRSISVFGRAALDAERAASEALPAGAPIHARSYTRLQPGGGTRRYEVSIVPTSAAYDLSVVERVVEWLSQHRQRYVAKPSTFAIALSRAAAVDADFAARLEACLSRFEIGDGMLMLVLPATAWSATPDQVVPLLAACERAHCHVLLDDFALNDAAVELLRHKAVRMLKLSSALTTAAIEERYPRALLAACTQIARVLGIHLVAKNVTTPTASRWLANAGIDYLDPLNPSETDVATTTGEQPALRQVS